MNDDVGHATRLAWAVGLPGRFRGLVVRHLRHPAVATERFDEIVGRMDLLAHNANVERQRLGDERAAEVHALDAHIRRLDGAIAHLAAQLARRDEELAEVWRRLGSTSTALIEQVAALPGPDPTGAGPVLTIILPVKDRAEVLRRAVRSVLAQTYPRWELVIVDDGSQVDMADELGDLVDDARVVLTRTSGLGAAGARNVGLALGTGELVTFLDSDNWWYPRRLELVVDHLTPDAEWAVDQQLVRTRDGYPDLVRAAHEPLEDLGRANFIDLGMIVVRPAALAAVTRPGTEGPFDPDLARLSDWDLIQRLVARQRPQLLPGLSQVYDGSAEDRISVETPYGPAFHTIRARAVAGSAEGLRVLSAEWHFPQLTETYIQADVAGLLALGAEVEVWSSEDVAVPYEPGVAWRRGRLEDHIADFRPDLVLTHWLNIGRDLRPTTRALGIPHTVRAHGFDYDEEAIRLLAADPGVALHLFAHQAGSYAAYPNVSIEPVGFDPGRVWPRQDQDRRMVLRVSAGLATKDLETFLLTAQRCPDHRFVLGLGHSYLVEEQTEAIVQLARDLDSPAEVLVDLDHAKAAELTMAAGTYLHTHGESHRLGMPVSPLEAMAAGAYVLARDLPGSEYLGNAAARYAGPTAEARADHAAALVNDTLTWSDERWASQRRTALDHAWSRHAADLVAADLVDTWRRRFAL